MPPAEPPFLLLSLFPALAVALLPSSFPALAVALLPSSFPAWTDWTTVAGSVRLSRSLCSCF